MAAERQAHAEVLQLLQVLVNKDGIISELQAALVEAQGLTGVAASLDEEVEVAAEENKSLNECVVCLDATTTVAVVPCCGHKCLCEACAELTSAADPCDLVQSAARK